MRRLFVFALTGLLSACGVASDLGEAGDPSGAWSTASAREEALGPRDDVPPQEQRFFAVGDHFTPLPKPGPHDWLANHPEAGQTFRQFLRSGSNTPGKPRRVIYLQPVGPFPKGDSPSLERLEAFTKAFFMLPVTVLPKRDIDELGLTTRRRSASQRPQMLAPDVLGWLEKVLPKDGFCILAVTMMDLYPEPSWNYVFGLASLRARVGVFSFARYDPKFFGEERGADYETVLLRRSCKVLSHEAAHMFGLLHCVYYSCGMAGSNNLPESDARPIHCCPICLRKLHAAVGFDLAKRYKGLAHFYDDAGFDKEATWIQKRLSQSQ